MNKKRLIWPAAVILVAACWYYIANYTSYLSKTHLYYGFYDNVRGLQEGAPVYIQGVKVGSIEEIDLNIKEKVRVVFAIRKDIQIPSGSEAVITTGDISGSKSVRLNITGGAPFIPPGGMLVTAFDSSMVESFHAKISPVLHSGKVLLRSADTALNDFNKLIRGGWGAETRKGFASVNSLLGNAARSSGAANRQIQNLTAVDDLDEMLSDPSGKNARVNDALRKAETQTAKAASSDFRKEMDGLRKSFTSLSNALKKSEQSPMLSDTLAYRGLERGLDTFSRSTRAYYDNPPALIQIGGGKKKK